MGDKINNSSLVSATQETPFSKEWFDSLIAEGENLLEQLASKILSENPNYREVFGQIELLKQQRNMLLAGGDKQDG